jgi:hypothetical protein|tara:strand:+ start:1938 stop:3497 length:1560 start_codon:yes stop_codon:yes gene_type:complete
MGLISINGSNPFDGQKDPYLSLDSNIDYNQNPNGDIKNTYTLEGVLTGCNKNTLNTLRDDLVRSFDWKEDSTIPENIIINGIISANQSQRIIPTSLDFESSNYIGSLAYTIKLEVFTGFSEEAIEEESLINKTHTVTTTVNEKGCVNVSTNISCSPNENLTGCGAIDQANAWIKKQLGVVQVGQVSAQASYPLQNESLTINPVTSEVSYSSTHGHNCDQAPERDKQDVPGISGLQIAQCVETNTEQPECGTAISTSKYQGEVYKKGADSDELLGYLSNQILSNHTNIKNLSTQYSSSSDNITFSFDVKEQNGEPVYEPTDEIINDYTVSTSTNHDDGSSSISINGSYKLMNPKEKTKDEVLEKDDDEVQSEAESNAGAGGFDLKSKSITRNPQAGTLSYSYGWESPTNPDDDNGLQGKSGVYSYSVSVSEPLRQYAIVPVLGTGCPDYIIDLGYCSKGSISVNTTVQSGANANGQSIINDMINSYGGQNMVVTEDSTNTSSDGTVSMSYSATFNSDNCS